MHNFDYYYLLSEYLNFNELTTLQSDFDLATRLKSQLGNRGVIYTRLLEDYVNITKTRNGLKEFHKWAFFWITMIGSMIIMCFTCQIINRTLQTEEFADFISAVPVIIAALVSLLSTIIGVPLTITKFLFNNNEDDNITQTIHHTQDHDSDEAMWLLRHFPDKPRPRKKKSQDRSVEEFDNSPQVTSDYEDSFYDPIH